MAPIDDFGFRSASAAVQVVACDALLALLGGGVVDNTLVGVALAYSNIIQKVALRAFLAPAEVEGFTFVIVNFAAALGQHTRSVAVQTFLRHGVDPYAVRDRNVAPVPNQNIVGRAHLAPPTDVVGLAPCPQTRAHYLPILLVEGVAGRTADTLESRI